MPLRDLSDAFSVAQSNRATHSTLTLTSTKNPADFPQGNGRYKTRTCDLHDVNVAL